MAARRPAADKRAVAEFVSELYDRSGAASQREFAQRLGVLSDKVSDWKNGKAIPSGWYLFSMIRIATGWEEAATDVATRELRTLRDEIRRDVDVALAHLASQEEEAAKRHEREVARLAEQVGQLAVPQQPQSARKRPRADGAKKTP